MERVPAGPGARPVAGKKTGKCYHPNPGRSTRPGALVTFNLSVRTGHERMTLEERATLIQRYAAGFDEVAGQLLRIMEPADLTAHPIPGKWSAQEIVHHLADSEMTAALRLRRLIAEDHPVIHGYDQERFAQRLRYDERPIEPSLAAFRAARESTHPLLLRLREDEWTRAGWHTDSGLYTPEIWLRIYAAHAHDHAAQIGRLSHALAR